MSSGKQPYPSWKPGQPPCIAPLDMQKRWVADFQDLYCRMSLRESSELLFLTESDVMLERKYGWMYYSKEWADCQCGRGSSVSVKP